MISFFNISNFPKWKSIYIMSVRIALEILDMIVLHFSIQGEDIMEYTNVKYDVFTFMYAKGRYYGAY